MLKFTVGGKNVSPSKLFEAMEKQSIQMVKNEMRERFATIREPETGEFPTVVVEGDDINDLKLRIEGSPKMSKTTSDRLSETELEQVEMFGRLTINPVVFLSYAHEDKETARKIATAFMNQGIDVWWDEWEMFAGDSLRQKVDDGLNNCTHFIVLLTATSITKPWVNQEMDAGFMLRIQNRCRFLPIRSELQASELPPLLSGFMSPEIDQNDELFIGLINDVKGVTKKPPRNILVENADIDAEYSQAAMKIAKFFVEKSPNALFADMQPSTEELSESLGLTLDDISDALYELRLYFRKNQFSILPEGLLYADFDKYWRDWNPEHDALKLAADLVNDVSFPSEPNKIAELYGWEQRRMNPAIWYLKERDIARVLQAISGDGFAAVDIAKTEATRRFVKSRSS